MRQSGASFGWAISVILLKYAIRELKNHWRFTLTFVLNLSIGLIGYLALTGFQDSLSNFLSERSLTLLGADISASARRPFSDEEVLKMQNVLGSENQTSKGLSLYTMAKGPARSRLISLKVFDEKFPFYGEIKLEDGKVYTSQDSKIFHGEDPKTNGGRRKVWIFPELQAQLGIKVGQSLKIGEAEFEVSGVVISDSTEVSSAASLAPKVYMSLFDIEKTGLLGFGSSASHLLFFKIPDRDLAAKKVEEIYQILDDPSVRVQDYKSASQQVNRGLGYLTDYLGLVVLVGLSLAAVGAGFLFQSFLSRRLKEIAILRSLGLSANKSVVIFGIEIVLMGLLSVLPAIVFTQLVFPLISEWIQELFSFPLKVSLSLGSVVTVACVATLGSLLICLPQLMALKALKPKDIFEDP
jgi:putative ABC transport system permease protein